MVLSSLKYNIFFALQEMAIALEWCIGMGLRTSFFFPLDVCRIDGRRAEEAVC